MKLIAIILLITLVVAAPSVKTDKQSPKVEEPLIH